MQEIAPNRSETGTRPLVIGIGAAFRGDDEIGLIATETLQKRVSAGSVDFAFHSDDAARIIGEWTGRNEVLVIDAVRAGAPAGTLHRIDINETALIPKSRTSSHGNALTDAIELSRALGNLPSRVVVIGIEPETTGLGEQVSEACTAALPGLVEMAKEEITCMSLQ